mmetsp:Transcript_18545/g.42042  ORF Transcript_18545/g.42042 Transcript_18545/m.42042 type:complete len:219 (-) Transcript_18545:171-827(-)
MTSVGGKEPEAEPLLNRPTSSMSISPARRQSGMPMLPEGLLTSTAPSMVSEANPANPTGGLLSESFRQVAAMQAKLVEVQQRRKKLERSQKRMENNKRILENRLAKEQSQKEDVEGQLEAKKRELQMAEANLDELTQRRASAEDALARERKRTGKIQTKGDELRGKSQKANTKLDEFSIAEASFGARLQALEAALAHGGIEEFMSIRRLQHEEVAQGP